MQTVQHSLGRKVINISSKRQITIPQQFFQKLNFQDSAECILRDNEIVLRPVKRGDDSPFAEQILNELIHEGLSGEALLAAFKERQARVRPAVEAMICEADAIAKGEGDYVSYDEIFGDEAEDD